MDNCSLSWYYLCLCFGMFMFLFVSICLSFFFISYFRSLAVATATKSCWVVWMVSAKDLFHFSWSNKKFCHKWGKTNHIIIRREKMWVSTYILNCDCFHKMSDESWGKMASLGSVLKLCQGWSTSRVMYGRQASDDLK